MTGLLKTLLILFAAAVLLGCKSSPNELAERLKRQLKEERYAQIYDESSDFMHRNAAKEEFVARLKEVVGKMKQADPELNWSENIEIGNGSGIDGTRYFVRKEMGEGSNRVVVLMDWWTNENGQPLLSSMSLVLSDQSTKRYSVPK